MPPEDGTAGATSGSEESTEDQVDLEAAKAALKVVEDMKAAGLTDPTGALATIQKLREFEKGTKLPKAIEKELTQLREAAATADKDKLTADERLKAELADLKAELAETAEKGKTRVAKSALKASAAAAGALYPDDVPQLVPASDLTFDEDGNPTNTDALVDGLKKSRPALFGTSRPSFDGGARGGPPAKQDMEHLLREAAGH